MEEEIQALRSKVQELTAEVAKAQTPATLSEASFLDSAPGRALALRMRSMELHIETLARKASAYDQIIGALRDGL